MEDGLVIIIVVLNCLYVLFCLINGRATKNELRSKGNIGLIFFGLIGVLLYIKSRSLICLMIMVLAGLIYNVIPSGYSNIALFIKGRRFLYKDISSIDVTTKGNEYSLAFIHKGRKHILFCDKTRRDIILEIEKYYGKKVTVHD